MRPRDSGGVDKPRPSRIEFRHEDFGIEREKGRAESSRCRREIGLSVTGHIRIPRSIYRNIKAFVVLRAAKNRWNTSRRNRLSRASRQTHRSAPQQIPIEKPRQ